jgi:hypothetical protein
MSAYVQHICQHMPVIASCGCRVGVVDRVEGDEIKLKEDEPSGRHHIIPVEWIEYVDDAVRLNRDTAKIMRDWKIVEPAGAA